MGTKIHVASTVYNLTGEEEKPSFLVSTLFSAVMANYDAFIGETVVRNYLTGPGIKQRLFFNWAKRTNYVGNPTFTVRNVANVDPTVVRDEIDIPVSPAGLETVIQSAFVTDADLTHFAEEYIIENHPTLLSEDWSADYDEDVHEITIQFPSDPTVIFDAGDYDITAQYLVARYYFALPTQVDALVTGTETTDETDALNLPDDTGYTLDSTTNTDLVTHTRNRNTLVVDSYSDATPDATISDTDEDISSDFQNFETLKTKDQYNGGDGDTFVTTSTEFFQYVEEKRYIVETVTTTTEDFDEGGGVTRTRTTTVTEDTLEPIWDFRTDTQETTNNQMIGGAKILIYEIGSGNAVYDALAAETAEDPEMEYFPFIPVRLNNVAVDHPVYVGNGLYAAANKAYKKATNGQKFDELLEEIEDNEDIDDIDYCYVAYGVPLNVKDNTARKYIYEFFKGLIPYQSTATDYMDDFAASSAAYDAANQAVTDWIYGQADPSDPLYGTPQPPIPNISYPRATTIRIKTDNFITKDYDQRLSWVNISEELFDGVGKVGAKRKDVWLVNNPDYEFLEQNFTASFSISDLVTQYHSSGVTEIYYQYEDNKYKKLTITGLEHKNFVYGGKSVDITASEALDDEETSGFFVPLHMPTLKDMGLVDATQLALNNTYLIFNSYKIVKTRWYQTFLGMLVIFIAIVIVAAVIAPAAVGGAGGIFGTNAAVGASFGLTGTSAVVAGAVTNALAGVLISRVLAPQINNALGDILGDKWGAIVGSFISFAAGGGLASVSNLGSLQSILNIGNVVANGYNGWVQANIIDMNDEMQDASQQYRDQLEEINSLMEGLGINNSLSFDPISLTDINEGNNQNTAGYLPESVDEFIRRTLMSGSDVVELTISMIDDYAKYGLTLPKN